jgi:hypothetical protein
VAHFIQVTRAQAGDPTAFVNVENIFAITTLGERGTRFHSVGGDKDGGSVTFTVREGLAEIMAQIPQSMKEN